MRAVILLGALPPPSWTRGCPGAPWLGPVVKVTPPPPPPSAADGGSLHSSDLWGRGTDMTQIWGGELDRLMIMTEAMRTKVSGFKSAGEARMAAWWHGTGGTLPAHECSMNMR